MLSILQFSQDFRCKDGQRGFDICTRQLCVKEAPLIGFFGGGGGWDIMEEAFHVPQPHAQYFMLNVIIHIMKLIESLLVFSGILHWKPNG